MQLSLWWHNVKLSPLETNSCGKSFKWHTTRSFGDNQVQREVGMCFLIITNDTFIQSRRRIEVAQKTRFISYVPKRRQRQKCRCVVAAATQTQMLRIYLQKIHEGKKIPRQQLINQDKFSLPIIHYKWKETVTDKTVLSRLLCEQTH